MKRIGILVAMDKEFVQLKTLLQKVQTVHRNLKDFVKGHMGDVEIIMQQCGVGKVNSAIGAVEMIDCFHPDLMISTGVAGGADTELNPLDVVVASECTYHDVYCGVELEYGQVMDMPPRFVAPADLVDKALRLNGLDMGVQVKSGLTVSGDWFVDSREKMQEILSHFPQAMAVDMESCSIAQTCHVYNVPFISFRIISDVPLKDNRAAQYFDFWDRMAEGSFEITKAFLKQII